MPPRRDPNNNNNINDVMQQMRASQTQLVQMMTQFVAHQKAPPPAPVDRLTRFLKLKPSKFSTTSEPIVANDWLRSVNKDLVTCECTESEKVRFTAHLLEGPAAQWWETYQITHPLEGLTWDVFKEGFCNTHIFSRIMNLKRDEFRSLGQGNRTLKEYMDDFFSLSSYAPEDIDTDYKRKDKFLNGQSGELKVPLLVAYAPNYQALLDQAITLDSNLRKEENKKRKRDQRKYHSGSHQKTHTSYEDSDDSEFSHQIGHNHHYHNICRHNHHGWNVQHNHGHLRRSGHKGTRKHGNGESKGHKTFRKKDITKVGCLKCKKKGHYVRDCLENKVNPDN